MCLPQRSSRLPSPYFFASQSFAVAGEVLACGVFETQTCLRSWVIECYGRHLSKIRNRNSSRWKILPRT